MKTKVRLKQYCLLSLMACLIMTFFITVKTQAAETTTYKDGTYTGSGSGYGGTVELSVTVENGKISAITEVSQKETTAYWNDAKTLFDVIIKNQSTAVDSVSGATKSSEAIKEAVNNALKQAATEDLSKPDASIFASGKGTASDPFIVKTAAQFKAFAASVKDVCNYEGYTVKLANDIDISGSDWTPIGGSTVSFNGTLDGNGHAITGLTEGSRSSAKVMDEALNHIGLFGTLGGKAVIKNVTLKNVYMNMKYKEIAYVGAFAGATAAASEGKDGAKITGCKANGTIIVNNERGNIWLGGYVGMLFDAAIINSASSLDLYATENTPTSYGTTESEYWVEAGGFTGLNFWSLIANSYNTGDVYAKYYDQNSPDTTYAAAGGLVGLDYGAVINNYSTGNVTSATDSKWVGSLIGLAESTVMSYNWYSTDSVLKSGSATAVPDASNITNVPEDDKDKVTAEENNAFNASNAKAMTAKLNAAITRLSGSDTLKEYGVAASNLTKWYYNSASALPSHEDTDIPLSKCTITGIKNKTYTGKKQTLSIRVTYAGKSVPVSITYASNKNIGTASVTITGKENITGKVTKTFKILPAKTKITAVKRGKKKLKVTYKKLSGGVKYQIAYRKAGSSKWIYKTSSANKKTITKLKSKKKYAVKVRAYKKVSGKTYTGSWSAVKTVKVK